MPPIAAALAEVLADPDGSVLLFDFDGSLSPIVDDPASARPGAGVVVALGELAARYRRVAVVSGRPVSFLSEHLPPAIDLSGLYGLEARIDGRRVDRDDLVTWRSSVERAADAAAARGPSAMSVEAKGLSLTLHYRADPSIREAVAALAGRLASETGLVARDAKMSVELHPPVAADKGSVVRELAAGARHVVYLGDDLGDLPAYAALGDLARTGVDTVAVAVAGPETPPAVLDAADVVVDGPDGVVELLAVLVARPAPGPPGTDRP